MNNTNNNTNTNTEVAPAINVAAAMAATQDPVAPVVAPVVAVATPVTTPLDQATLVTPVKEKKVKEYVVAPATHEASFQMTALKDVITSNFVSTFKLSNNTAVTSFKNGKTDNVSDKTLSGTGVTTGHTLMKVMVPNESLEAFAITAKEFNESFLATIVELTTAKERAKEEAKVLAEAKKAEKEAAKVLAAEEKAAKKAEKEAAKVLAAEEKAAKKAAKEAAKEAAKVSDAPVDAIVAETVVSPVDIAALVAE